MTHTLLSKPTLAATIAAYIGLWSGVEFVFAGILDRALGGASRAYEVIGRIPNISQRMREIRWHHSRLDGETWATDALAIMSELQHCREYRNKLAHGWYAENVEQESVLLLGNPIDVRRPFSQEVITIQSVVAEYSRLNDAIHRLIPLALTDGQERRIIIPGRG